MSEITTDKAERLASVYKLGHEIGKKRFFKAMTTNTSRFNAKSSVIFGTLHNSLHFQLKNHVNFEFRKTYKQSYGPTAVIPLDVLLKQASKDLIQLADGIAAKEGIKIAKKNQLFHFDKDVCRHHESYIAKLHSYAIADRGDCSFLNSYSGGYSFGLKDCLSGFDAACFVSEVKDFITCVDTLVSPTGLPKYERMLSEISARDDYWGMGCYPKDILCIDRLALDGFYNTEPIESIAIRKDYASSHLLYTGISYNVDHKTHDIYSM